MPPRALFLLAWVGAYTDTHRHTQTHTDTHRHTQTHTHTHTHHTHTHHTHTHPLPSFPLPFSLSCEAPWELLCKVIGFLPLLVCNENIIYSRPLPGRGTLPFIELAQSCEAIQASQPPAGQLRFPDNALLRLCPTITPSSEVALTGPGLGGWILRIQDHHPPSHK